MLLKKVYFTYFIHLRIPWWIQWHWLYCYFVKFAYQKMNFLLCMGWISNGLNVFKFKLMHLFICAFFWHDFFLSLFCLFVFYTMKTRDQDKMVSLSSSPVYFLISGESTVKNLMLSIWQYTCTLALLETNCYLQWYMFVSIYFGKCCLPCVDNDLYVR